MKTIIDWRVFAILLSLSLLSIFAVFPYVVSLQSDVFKELNQPVIIIFFLQLIQSAILFSLVIFLGLILIKKVNFRLPLFNAIVLRKNYQKLFREISLLSILLGIITSLTIYAADYVFTLLGAAISTSESFAPIWQKLLASFYGGITEEILMRLFLMTLFVWIGTKLTKQSQPKQPVILISILLAAIIFGLGHLPITASLTTLTPIIITRAIILNGIGGIIFGWLFWKKGLEAAMIAHFTTDVFLLTILPLIFNV